MITPTEAHAIRFFVAQALRHARSLPIREAQVFLHGLLLIGGEREELEPLRTAHNDLFALNQQLEELQLKLI